MTLMKLSKVYEPAQFERDIYALWEKSEAFAPKHRGSKENYSIVMPPPNANGNLHIGHALTTALQDVLIRYHRLRGKATLYLPGADHAGFETWVVYEKELNKQDKTRFDFSREELYEQVWDFVQMNKGNFENQMRALGASCDWSRYTFTLDQKVVDQSYKTFKKLWDDKLIYRGERIVNFCTFHGTSFSDIEVVHEEEKSKLWHIAYTLADGSGEVVIATTRPETKLGQAALMVNPKDKRYKQFVGKIVNQPLVPDVPIKIIADEHVDPDFGTGVVTVTPGHDINDFEVAAMHNLPSIELITHEGKMSRHVPVQFQGMTVIEAREAVAKELEERGYMRKVEDYTHSVAKCYKCGTVIEPLIREQWFLDMKPLANPAIKALRDKKIRFFPESKNNQAVEYLKGIRDWNISRQIAWGIPIPAFQNVDDPEDWIYDERVDQEILSIENKTYRRDPDVFDTWFSSGQWPYVTLGYPDNADFKQFYPLDVMETGSDLLYQWVCRMIMLGLYTTGDIPFKDVYMHGMVLDGKGQKMSKSKGNVINPMDVVDKFGSDAMRMGVITGMTAGHNQPFGEPKVIAARNFCNKLWNIARFVEDKIGNEQKLGASPKPKSGADHWILNKINYLSTSVSSLLEDYRISEAYEALYHFVWDDLADWYVEASKTELNPSVLAYTLQSTLKISHPFAPFLTETIWQTLAEEGSMLITNSWPEQVTANNEEAKIFEEIKRIVTEIRYIKGELHVRNLHLYHKGEKFLAEHGEIINNLARLDGVTEVRDGYGLHLTETSLTCWLDIDQQTSQHFLKQLSAKKATYEASIKQLEARLTNKAYVSGAPKHVVDQTKTELKDAKELLAKISTEYERFSGASHA